MEETKKGREVTERRKEDGREVGRGMEGKDKKDEETRQGGRQVGRQERREGGREGGRKKRPIFKFAQ